MEDAAPFSSSAQLVFSTAGPGVLFALALRASAVTGSRLSFHGLGCATAIIVAPAVLALRIRGPPR